MTWVSYVQTTVQILNESDDVLTAAFTDLRLHHISQCTSFHTDRSRSPADTLTLPTFVPKTDRKS
jgi:hypothetical protein